MFQIKNIQRPDIKYAVQEEREDRFIGESRLNDPGLMSGMQFHAEYLKTHWQRVEAWQDVTRELQFSDSGQTLAHGTFGFIVNSNRYRFVKVECYTIPEAVLNKVPHDTGFNLGFNLGNYRTTLLRVERKAD